MKVRRADYMQAMLDLTFDLGYEEVAIEQIAAAAGGTAADFKRHFPTKLDCAVAILEELAENNLRAVRGAFDSEAEWPDSLRAAAYAHARWIAENPKKMHFGLLEMLWASDLTGALRDHLFGSYIAMVDAGREVTADPDAIADYTAESVVGSITQVLVRRLDKSALDLYALVPEMMYLAVRPYLGEEAARKELTIPPPDREGRSGAT
ncbi:MAG TPA: hypothetical protein VI039_08725 [Solirubrobacterales bacterium]